jgi:cyclophilin family peptidyl-prolyl cis-trans isomerase/protein-disulfide isomerase
MGNVVKDQSGLSLVQLVDHDRISEKSNNSMPHRIFILTLVVALLIAACQTNPVVETPTQIPPTPTTEITSAAPVRAQAKCTVTSSEPTGNSTEGIIPAVTESDWTRGPTNPRVTILEYSDFQCPACRSIIPVLDQLMTDFPDDVRIVYRHFPLMSIHQNAAIAAQASEAAGAQGEFWALHDLLFERQEEWEALPVEEFETWLVDRATELNLDAEKFKTDMLSEAMVTLAEEAWEFGAQIGLPGTPFIVINGGYYGGPMDYSSLSAIVKLELLKDQQYTNCPPMEIDPNRQYLATIHTEKGDIRLELFPEVAPMAVNNFIFLARNGWYDQVTFHRVIPGFMAQAGDPTGTGFGGPGYAFENEVSPDLKFDKPGVLGMANAGPGSNGSQFYITYTAAPHLDGDFTIFGQVIAGMEVLEALTPRNPQVRADLPPGDLILGITIEEK